MTRPSILVAALAAALAAVPARAGAQQPPTATFRAGADGVAVEASVRRDKRAGTRPPTSSCSTTEWRSRSRM